MYKNLVKFFSHVTASFFIAVSVITISGMLLGDVIVGESSFYVHGGVSFTAILQLLALTVILAFCNLILDQPRILPDLRLTYKIILRIAICMAFMLPFIYICRWFPVNDHEAWIGFVLCFLISFMAATSLSVYATHRKDKEYQKLLDAYKAKKEREK